MKVVDSGSATKTAYNKATLDKTPCRMQKYKPNSHSFVSEIGPSMTTDRGRANSQLRSPALVRDYLLGLTEFGEESAEEMVSRRIEGN